MKSNHLISHDKSNYSQTKCKLAPKARTLIFNKCISPLAHWLGLDVFGTPVRQGDPVYWPLWDNVPISNAEYITEVGTRGFFLSSHIEDPDDCDEFYPYSDIGKYTFLCEEDVEKWIKRMDTFLRSLFSKTIWN